VDKETYNKYTNNEIIMKSVEFGLIPLQTIFDKKNIIDNKKRKTTYEKQEVNLEKEINGKDKKNRNRTIKDKNFNIINNEKNINNDDKKIILKKEKNKEIYEYNDNNEINPFYYRDNYNIKFEIEQSYNYQKINIYINDKLKEKIYDHNEKINYIFYNPRLNMFATSSYDGLVCIYVFPNKLFSVIKHPKNLFFDKIFLSANPFPTIITFEKTNNILCSYSLSGILIKEKKIYEENKEIDVNPKFNIIEGIFIDSIEITFKGRKQIKIYNLPFFEQQKQ
jgi:WD40 repeat protein